MYKKSTANFNYEPIRFSKPSKKENKSKDPKKDMKTKIEERVEIPEGFLLCATQFNSKDPDTRDVVNYAVNRGCNQHKMWYLRLGVSQHPKFRRSLIIPSFDENGEINIRIIKKKF